MQWSSFLLPASGLWSPSKENAPHQVQLQLYVGADMYHWCDYYIFTCKGLSVQLILPDAEWQQKCIPEFQYFFDDYVAPELVYPQHKPNYFLYTCNYNIISLYLFSCHGCSKRTLHTQWRIESSEQSTCEENLISSVPKWCRQMSVKDVKIFSCSMALSTCILNNTSCLHKCRFIKFFPFRKGGIFSLTPCKAKSSSISNPPWQSPQVLKKLIRPDLSVTSVPEMLPGYKSNTNIITPEGEIPWFLCRCCDSYN